MEKNGKMPGGLDGDTSLNLDEKNISTIENDVMCDVWLSYSRLVLTCNADRPQD